MNLRWVRHVLGWSVFGVSVACALALGASPASAVVIDFESLMQVGPGFDIHSSPYSEDGFTLSIPGGGAGV